MKKGKILALVFMLIVSVVLIAACAGDGGSGSDSAQEALSRGGRYPLIEDMDGYVFTIADNEHSRYFNPQAGRNDLADAQVDLIRKLEQSFNIKLEIVETDPIISFDIILPKYLAGEKYADLIVANYYNAGKFYSQNMLEDLGSIPGMNLSAPYWDKNIIASVNPEPGVTHFAIPEWGYSYALASVVFYNKTLINELGLEDPYELYKNGRWTMDKYVEMARAATRKLSGTGEMTWDDQWGVVAEDIFNGYPNSLYFASGLKMIDIDNTGRKIYGFNTPQAKEVLTDIQEMIINGGFHAKKEGYISGQDSGNKFKSGSALFITTGVETLPHFASMDDDFGVVPMPKGKFTDKYIAPINFNAAVFCVQRNNPDLDKVGTILDAMAEWGEPVLEAQIDEFDNRFLRDASSREVMANIRNDYLSVDLGMLSAADRDGITQVTIVLISHIMTDINTKAASTIDANAERAQQLIDDFWNKSR